MIHRAMFGSLERFLGILIEHVGGAFPVWLAPIQAIVLPVSEKFLAYAEKVRQQMLECDLRVQVDARNEKLGYKIREAQLHKIPFMLVVGAREAEGGQVAVRLRNGEDLGAQDLGSVIERLQQQVRQRSREL
jgi:threonyl-tRNA synthetase